MEIDSTELAATLLLKEFTLSIADKDDLKKHLIKYRNHGVGTAVKYLECYLSDVNCWPRGKRYLEKNACYPDDEVSSQELAELLHHTYSMAEYKIHRARQINSMLLSEQHMYHMVKVFVNGDHDFAPCGLKNGDLKPIPMMLPLINQPICEHLGCSCSFTLAQG